MTYEHDEGFYYGSFLAFTGFSEIGLLVISWDRGVHTGKRQRSKQSTGGTISRTFIRFFSSFVY